MTKVSYSPWYSKMFYELDSLFGGIELIDVTKSYNHKQMFNIRLRGNRGIFSYGRAMFPNMNIFSPDKGLFNTVLRINDPLDVPGSAIHELIELLHDYKRIYIVDYDQNSILADAPFNFYHRDGSEKFLANFKPLKMKLQIMGVI